MRTAAFYAASFLGAFLLFQVQPMSSKALLPTFGGSYLVWGSCMVFYQSMLLAGYVYAHLVQRHIGVRRYGRWHPLLLLLPLAWLPFRFETLAPLGDLPLALQVFVRLALAVGIPFIGLATVSLVLQRWFDLLDTADRPSPYVLYSASNLGSVVGLLSYPLLIEPLLGLRAQSVAWAVAYAVLVLLHVVCRPHGGTPAPGAGPAPSQREAPPPLPQRTLGAWLALSAGGCAMLLAVTNVITFDIASVPFLWVLPLAAYLLTFVLTFKDRAWLPAWLPQAFTWAAVLGGVLYLMGQLRMTLPALVLLPLQLGILFVVCMRCHGRLIRTRPDDVRHLTTFYIMIALGGVLGSLAVSWLAPVVTTSLAEYPAALALAALALALSGERAVGAVPGRRGIVVWTAVALAALLLVPRAFVHAPEAFDAVLLVAVGLPVTFYLLRMGAHPALLAAALMVVTLGAHRTDALASGATDVLRHRNFYGIYRVFDADGQRYLQHGTTAHGREVRTGPVAGQPVGYYAPNSPVGDVLTRRAESINDIAMVGLGSGALARYARPGATFTVFELDPDNLPIAEAHFSYLTRAAAQGVALRHVFGDGRIRLREEAANAFDVLIVDAFNSGSIPVHLLTREALQDYFRVLREDGVLLMHISNRALDLEPVVASVADAIDVHALFRAVEADPERHLDASTWAALTRDEALRDDLRQRLRWRTTTHRDLARPWTDQYSNLLHALF